MNSKDRNRQRLTIPQEEEKSEKRSVLKARSSLYRLIARFRKNARQADNVRTESLFTLAAELLGGLVRVFRSHEKQIEEEESTA